MGENDERDHSAARFPPPRPAGRHAAGPGRSRADRLLGLRFRQPAGSAGAKGAVSTLEAAKAAGKIRIGYANEAPFAYMDSQRAEVTGESVEIARVVLKRMGINRSRAC